MRAFTLVGLLCALTLNCSWAFSEGMTATEGTEVVPLKILIDFPHPEIINAEAKDTVRLRFRNNGIQRLRIKKVDPTSLVPDVFVYSLNSTDPNITRLTPLREEVRSGHFRRMLHEIETTLQNPVAFLEIPPGGDYELVLNLEVLRRAFESAPTGKGLIFKYRVPKLILSGTETPDAERFNNYMAYTTSPMITIREGRWEKLNQE